MLYPPQAHMNDKSYAEWAIEWWKWNFQFDCAHFLLRDVDGSLQNQNQSGPVYFLAGRRGNTLNVTVPTDASVFISLITFETDGPANPGETLEQTLNSTADLFVNSIDGLSLTIDGRTINHLEIYKLLTPLYFATANADLANCYDDALTGSSQEFKSGGYFIMLKPLTPGTHLIHRVGGASALFPFVYDITYNITQL